MTPLKQQIPLIPFSINKGDITITATDISAIFLLMVSMIFVVLEMSFGV